MTPKLLPALAAALFLAACGSGSDSQPAAPSTDSLASNGGDNGSNAGGVSQTGSMTSASAAAAQLVAIGNTVHFDTDSSSLDAAAQALLQKQAAFLQQDRAPTITIEGHADERGTREYNLALGERRAESVVNYLAALGVDPARLKEISYGKERPICPDATDACWGQNRRSVTTLDN